MKTDEDEIVIADCAQAFIDEYWRLNYQGDTSSIMSEIQEHGIESPPEQLWYAAANYLPLHDWAEITPQHVIGQYRVDFMIDPTGYFVNHPFGLFSGQLLYALGRTLQKFVVEIDGFEWHDKTPEQAERDKTRERYIQQQGFRLFRYAAREVLRDPCKCVREMNVLVYAELKKACGQLTIKRTSHGRLYDKWEFEGIDAE